MEVSASSPHDSESVKGILQVDGACEGQRGGGRNVLGPGANRHPLWLQMGHCQSVGFLPLSLLERGKSFLSPLYPSSWRIGDWRWAVGFVTSLEGPATLTAEGEAATLNSLRGLC